MKKFIKVSLVCCVVIFLISLAGSYYATRQHNDTVKYVALNSSTTNGIIIEGSVNDGVYKDNYKFIIGNKEYSGETYLHHHFTIGENICVKYNQDNPNENIYCDEDKIMVMDYFNFSTQVVGGFIILLFLGFIWNYLKGKN